METVISTTHLPAAERFEFFYDHISQMLAAPVVVTSDDPAAFRAEVRFAELGAVQFSSLVVSSCESRRTPKMIRKSDPDTFQLVFTQRGRNILQQDRREAALCQSDLVLYHTSRPFYVRTVADEDHALGVMAVIPRVLLPLPLHKIDHLTARKLTGSTGVGALLTGFLSRLGTDVGQYRIADASRLGLVLIDLLAILLAQETDADRSIPPETHQRTLLLRVHAFIQEHLAEPELSPGAIAAAHGISTRTLHRLFQAEGSTVSGWIRSRRLDRCRRDLADPMLWHRPIHAIAARWGFTDPAHFTRTFRNVYGLNPQDHRQQHQRQTREEERHSVADGE